MVFGQERWACRLKGRTVLTLALLKSLGLNDFDKYVLLFYVSNYSMKL